MDDRELIKELADQLQGRKDNEYGWPGPDPEQDLIDRARARARLAQPEPAGPTPSELIAFVRSQPPWREWTRSDGCLANAHFELAELLRDALTRWGAPRPVTVSERLPGPEHCRPHPRTGQGLWCWGLERNTSSHGMPARWRFMRLEHLQDEAIDWLPHWAIPFPRMEPTP